MTVLKVLCWLVALAAAGATIAAAVLASDLHGAALINNLLLQLAVGTALLTVLLLLLRRRRPALVLLLTLAGQALLMAPGAGLGQPVAAAASGPSLRLVTYNLLASNHEHARSLDFLRRTDADVIILQEVTAAWSTALQGLSDDYPHRVDCVAVRGCGLVILSRLPLAAGAAGLTADGLARVIEAQLSVEDQPVRVVGTHVMHGLYRRGFARQEHQLRDLAALLNAGLGPTVVAGDFNMAPWAPRLRGLADQAGLTVVPALVGTWPAELPVPARMPIDNVLISRDWQLVDREVGPALGSDHRPVTVTLQFTGR